MNKRTGSLESLEYPGRLLGLGFSEGGESGIVIYGIMGRSPSSQARKLVAQEDGVWVKPTDEDVLKTGHVDLLVYPAILFHDLGIAVSNGKQTIDIENHLSGDENPVALLAKALACWDYEPDEPIFTPRISGCVRKGKGALAIIRRGSGGESLRNYFEVAPWKGCARWISTYKGPNSHPLPSFEGEPLEIPLEGRTARQVAESIFSALAPSSPNKDFRVALACVFFSLSEPRDKDLFIINRHERN